FSSLTECCHGFCHTVWLCWRSPLNVPWAQLLCFNTRVWPCSL
ncbi:mCG141896, partial [Mus musculus]